MYWGILVIKCHDCQSDLTSITYREDRGDEVMKTAVMMATAHREAAGLDHRIIWHLAKEWQDGERGVNDA